MATTFPLVEPAEVISDDFCHKAWRRDIDGIAKALNSGEHTTIADWVVQAPWAHPFWHSYYITCIHLRPLGALPPAKIYLPGATHEIWVQAANPEMGSAEELAKMAPQCALTPPNFAAQFIAESDERAAALIREVVEDVLHQRLNPDTDARRQWIARFGDNMMKR